ncbi:MAG: endonuclease [Candidatus Eisenbacteria bacterium]
MRKSLILLFVVTSLLAGLAAPRARAGILMSEMCDPRLNYTTDRFIEIYNSGSEAADLTGWTLVAVGNGGDIFTWHLSGLIESGEALVAGDQTTVAVFHVDFPDEAWSSNNGLWNGKVGDGAKLLDSAGAVMDYAVVTGTAFENSDYTRQYGIVSPDTTYTPSEWTSIPVDLATDASPGTHSTTPPIPGPTITYVHTDPANPVAGEDVNVLAVVTDTLTITSVSLFWGTAPSSLPNEIVISVWSGSTYRTSTPVPGQSAGTTVYYKVRAMNSAPATSTSAVQNYALPYELTIYEVQGQASVSPYGGKAVITHGVVTARYGSYLVIQDGAGPWTGLWVQSTSLPAVGDSVTVRGTVTESAGLGYPGNTLLTGAIVLSDTPGAAVPEPVMVSTVAATSEVYEGVLIKVESTVCTCVDVGYGEWQVNDGSGPAYVDRLGYRFTPTLGTAYDVAGPLNYRYGRFKIEPRSASDIRWTGDASPPAIYYVTDLSDTTVLVTFTEAVAETSAEVAGNYTITGLDVGGAAICGSHTDQVLLTVSAMSPGGYSLEVSGVADLYGNVLVGGTRDFSYVENAIPAGYYDSAEGLFGDDLKAALHNIIKNHTVYGYDYAWTAYATTDVKPNGKVWDMYSDVPGGPQFYEYTLGVDAGGVGGQEGEGYTREHSWPKSWFGGEVSPMYCDLFHLYPTDAHVNGNRGNYPYGEVAVPEWTLLNGSERGPCSYPGYSGIVFDPIDEYKGDLARTYFYMSTRYYTEDAGWPGGPMTDGAELKPWAVNMLLEWNAEDPVSQKEIDRNGAICDLQHNRNPFIDRPEFADRMLAADAAVDGDHGGAGISGFSRIYPNPFGEKVTIRYSVAEAARLTIALYDVAGKKIATLVDCVRPIGEYQCGLDAAKLGPGIYFCKFQAGAKTETRKLVLLH